MTFEEFFKKKKIDLTALEQADTALFLELRSHFELMGEKSFDHTKKYWFNKLRRRYPLSPEIKTEKVRIENPLAEQTITESLLEEGLDNPATPKTEFTPRFRTAVVPPKALEEKIKPAENIAIPEKTEATGALNLPKPAGFTPRFKATAPLKKGEEVSEEKPTENSEPVKGEDSSLDMQAGNSQPYKPRFKPQMPPKKPEE
jgi:hypothetical protein